MKADKLATRILLRLAQDSVTSIELAAALDISLGCASGMLRDLYCCGALERELLPPHGRGRPAFRYRVLQHRTVVGSFEKPQRV